MRSTSLSVFSLMVLGAMICCAMAQDGGDDAALESPVPIYGSLKASETFITNTSVDTELASLSFILIRRNVSSSLDMIVVSPSGSAIDSSAEMPIIYEENNTLTYFIIPEPELGIWTAQVTAISVPETGESIILYTDYEALEDLLSEENLSDDEMIDICETCDQEE